MSRVKKSTCSNWALLYHEKKYTASFLDILKSCALFGFHMGGGIGFKKLDFLKCTFYNSFEYIKWFLNEGRG